MKKTTPIYQINFNIDQIGQSILEWLQESIDSSFTTDDTHEGVVGSDELFHFRAKCKTRIIAIIILKSGRLDLYLEREDKDTFYSLTANDSEKDNEGVTTFQLANSVDELIRFLSSGSFTRSHFSPSTSNKVDFDW